MNKGPFKLLPSYPIDVTHGNGFYQHDEQQREGGCVVVEYVKPVISSLRGEDQADDTVNETHSTCVDKTRTLLLHLEM